MFENYSMFLYDGFPVNHPYVVTKYDKGKTMSGNLKASLTISISLHGSYDGFDTTYRRIDNDAHVVGMWNNDDNNWQGNPIWGLYTYSDNDKLSIAFKRIYVTAFPRTK